MTSYETEINRFDRQKLAEYDQVAPSLAKGEFPYPKQITFFPTYRCNQHCPGCLYHTPEGKLTGEISLDDFQTVRDTFQRIGVERIEISGGGEPGCHPGFQQILTDLADITPQVGIISNGSAFSPADLQVIVERASYIRISLDSLTPAIYQQIHGRGANLSRVLSNLVWLKTYQADTSSSLIIGVKFLITRQNALELPSLIEWAVNSGLDHVQFKCIRQAPSELDSATACLLDEQLQQAKQANHSATAIYGSLLPIHAQDHCWTAALYSVIDPLGDVYLCCYYYDRMQELRIGNLLTQPFEALWGSEYHRQVIAGIQMQRCVHDCRFKMYNTLLKGVHAGI